MGALNNIAILERVRDHLDEIRELLGENWPDFIHQLQLSLSELACAQDEVESTRLINELIKQCLASRAKDTILRILEQIQSLDLDNTQSRRAAQDVSPLEDANSAAMATAANMLEWVPTRSGDRYHIVPVFFATDRKGLGAEKNPNKFFGGARGALSYGLARVSVPDRHKTGKIERPWRGFSESPEKHVALLNVEQLELIRFRERVTEAVKTARQSKILIFVHGYRVSFAEAARTIAQIVFDIDFTGIPFLYSWPSKGSFFAYSRDENNAAWTREHFLEAINTLYGIKNIAEQHLLAHSMGNRVLFQGLQHMHGQRFGQVILAAPDDDVETFSSQLHRFLGRGERNTLYASKKDFALRISNWIHGEMRAGQLGVAAAGLDTIDASAVNFSLFAHSYFHEQRALLGDISLLLEHGLAPDDHRPSIRRHPESEFAWQFQP